MPTSPFSEELGSRIKSFQEIFTFFRGMFFKSQQQKMREKKECSPRNSPCSTCSPSAEGSTFISCRFSFVLLRRGQIRTNFQVLPAWKGSCWQAEGTPSPFSQEQVSTGMMFSARRAGSSGLNALMGVLKPPHLVWHPCLAV